MLNGKPIIGLTGGIGAGKSFVAQLFAAEGCLVISSDQQVHEAYEREDVKSTLRKWMGDAVIDSRGKVDRSAVAKQVFENPGLLRQLEQLLHPLVNAARAQLMAKYASDPQVLAFVWDTPLLLETGLGRECDAVVFIDAPFETRLRRVAQARGWDEAQLLRREKLQLPLDKKRSLSQYVVQNTADANQVRSQVRGVLSRILDGVS